MSSKPQRYNLEVLNKYEELSDYIYLILKNNKGVKFKIEWQQILITNMLQCELELHSANSQEGTSRRMAMSRSEKNFMTVILLIRKGLRLEILTYEQYKHVSELVYKFEGLFTNWITKYNPALSFIKSAKQKDGTVKYATNTFSRFLQ